MDFRSLLPVQVLDQRLVQLEHRKAQLPERAAAEAARNALDVARREEQRTTKRVGDITGEIDRLEQRGKELDAKKAKYETQLKSVVVMREVEALQQEISGVNAEHSLLDDAELALLDEGERLGQSLDKSRTELRALEVAANEAADRLVVALAAIDGEIAVANDERARLVATVDTETIALYEQVRKRMTSAAVAEVTKGTCGGCRTALSPKEQAELKKVANTADARCPYCSCLLAF